MCNLLCFCWGKKEEKTEKQRLTKKKPESPIGYHFSERVFLSPPKTQSVKTVRLSENSFEHDFSDFSDPERKISYARRLCRQEEGEILQEFIPVSAQHFLSYFYCECYLMLTLQLW